MDPESGLLRAKLLTDTAFYSRPAIIAVCEFARFLLFLEQRIYASEARCATRLRGPASRPGTACRPDVETHTPSRAMS